MTELRFFMKEINGIPVGEESRFPALREALPITLGSKLPEEDGLYLGYGLLPDLLPYAMQDDYDLTELQPMQIPSAVLENEHLIAEFALSLGGRLWRLYDKDSQQELMTNNLQFIPRNLAIRNAWYAGGTEWNCGRRGHDANTCSDRFAAELNHPEYGPVLRIYDYSRDRKTPYQMDFFLPPGSRFLYSRVRLANPGKEVVPMYWWSNIAADITPGCRVVVPAKDTYSNSYNNGSHFINRVTLPDGDGFDTTYPDRFKYAHDHFYNIPADTRKYEALIKPDGKGLVHMSTRRLQGRKLFVWGDSPGGHHWQRVLLAPGVEDYLEIQGGLAKTQQEHLPMPPTTVWEWLEAFGAIEADPGKVFGEWDDAVQEVSSVVDAMLPESELDRILADTKESIAKQPGKLRHTGLAFAALEELRSGSKLAPQLDFGTPGEKQTEWVQLLNTGAFDDTPPRSYQVDPAWLPLMKKAPDTWKRNYHLGIYYFRQQDWERVRQFAERALNQNRNAWTLHLAGMAYWKDEDKMQGLQLLAEAARCPEADAYLVKDVLKLLILEQEYQTVLDLYPALAPIHQTRPMAKLQYAYALARTGKLAEAENVLLGNDGLYLPDVREGAVDITNLYIWLQEQKGIPAEKIQVPTVLDFRMKG
ncbi:MAG: DUF5107 domain-containing protein [Lentisphaeria bacterium]|nr:DUF5107 domain-containing protein [Lentisphaeria bacterium]